MQLEMGSDMTCTIEEEAGGVRLLRMEGELCMPAVTDLRRALLDALDGGVDAVAGVAGVRAVDLAGLQLLCSAHRSFQERCKNFRLRDVPEAFRRTAVEAGFRQQCSICTCRKLDCLWDF